MWNLQYLNLSHITRFLMRLKKVGVEGGHFFFASIAVFNHSGTRTNINFWLFIIVFIFFTKNTKSVFFLAFLSQEGGEGVLHFALDSVSQKMSHFNFANLPKDNYTVFRARRITFFPANRVKNQNEPKRRLAAPFGFVLVFNSAYGNGRHWCDFSAWCRL